MLDVGLTPLRVLFCLTPLCVLVSARPQHRGGGPACSSARGPRRTSRATWVGYTILTLSVYNDTQFHKLKYFLGIFGYNLPIKKKTEKKYMNAYHTSLVLLTKYVLKEHFEEEVYIDACFQAYAMTKKKNIFCY